MTNKASIWQQLEVQILPEIDEIYSASWKIHELPQDQCCLHRGPLLGRAVARNEIRHLKVPKQVGGEAACYDDCRSDSPSQQTLALSVSDLSWASGLLSGATSAKEGSSTADSGEGAVEASKSSAAEFKPRRPSGSTDCTGVPFFDEFLEEDFLTSGLLLSDFGGAPSSDWGVVEHAPPWHWHAQHFRTLEVQEPVTDDGEGQDSEIDYSIVSLTDDGDYDESNGSSPSGSTQPFEAWVVDEADCSEAEVARMCVNLRRDGPPGKSPLLPAHVILDMARELWESTPLPWEAAAELCDGGDSAGGPRLLVGRPWVQPHQQPPLSKDINTMLAPPPRPRAALAGVSAAAVRARSAPPSDVRVLARSIVALCGMP
mmetsp:Transcript_80005/g.216538  ORF Transcript_80005/g.216538 Transcript_80005/m.216538 type:complete len:372 (-) Transcript_80005:3-1118(-)